MKYPKTRNLVLGCVFSLLAAQACAPPAGWKGSPYLYGSRSYGRIAGGEEVRVLLHSGTNVSVFAKNFVFTGEKNSTSGQGRFVPNQSGKLISKDGMFRLKGKTYHGDLRIIQNGKQFQYINAVPLERYLVSVLAHEMSKTWPEEALKAQAVVARTYVRNRMRAAKNEPYDLTADTSSQVYGGTQKGLEKVEEAVIATRNQILTYHNLPAEVFFHSSCGGVLAAASEVWKKDIEYLRVKRTGKCAKAPVYKWSVSVPLSSLSAKLGVSVSDIRVVSRTESGRVKELAVLSSGKRKKIAGTNFRKILGAKLIRSTFFGVRVSGSNLIIAGRGYGHGVGMCQWGSRFMAESGNSYRAILRYYFPGTSISTGSPLV